MENLFLIIQIGIHILAMGMLYQIMYHKRTKTAPYAFIMAAMAGILALRLDNLLKIMPSLLRLAVQMFASVGFFIYFYKVRKELNK